MCGIVGVVRRRSQRAAPASGDLHRELAAASAAFAGDGTPAGRLGEAAAALERLDSMLRGVPGVLALTRDLALAGDLETAVTELERQLDRYEQELDDPARAPLDAFTTSSATASSGARAGSSSSCS